MKKILFFIIIILITSSCSSNKKEKRDTTELWSKAMPTGQIIKRSGTKLTSETASESGLAEKDAKNRLQLGYNFSK